MSNQLIAALSEALEDEYKALAKYRIVIASIGAIRPFKNIVEEVDRHASALLRQFERLGVQPPKDIWVGEMEAPSSIADACKAAIRSELENVEMYDRLLKDIDDHKVRKVFLNLQDASKNNHLPAFRRCLYGLKDKRKSL